MFGTTIDVAGLYSYWDNLQISHGVKAGNTIYISGQVALDPEGNVVGEGDAEAQARVENLQLKDLRTYFNRILKTNYNFTSKEAGAYIGNNEVVDELHYSPYHEPTIRGKMQKSPLKEALAGPWSE